EKDDGNAQTARLLGARRRAVARRERREHHLTWEVVAARHQERDQGGRAGSRIEDGRTHRTPLERSWRWRVRVKRPIAYFAGTGRGVPATVFKNDEFAKMGIETTDEWIVERTGIKERHIARTESATDLAAKASCAAMDKAGVSAGELDIIVLGTASP